MSRFRNKIRRNSLLALILVAVLGLGLVIYDSDPGLRTRAALGQSAAKHALSLQAYSSGDSDAAFSIFEELLLDGYGPAIQSMCDALDLRQSMQPLGERCLDPGADPIVTRLTQLGELAFFAREWRPLEGILIRRLEAGDTRAQFDFARFEAFSRPERLNVDAITGHLTRSAEASDPRGQYVLTVLNLRNVAESGATEIVYRSFAEALTKSPPLTDAEAYFELAKLMQSGLVSSDLHFTEVLRRADTAGSERAAGYLAQFYLNNPLASAPDGLDADHWLEKAAAHDDPVAQYNWATRLLEMHGQAVSMPKVTSLLIRSASRGFAPADTQLGSLLWLKPDLLGDTAERGRKRAMDHFARAAEAGDANALFNLGQIYLTQGQKLQAKKYFQKAKAQGNTFASQALRQFQ